MKQKYLNHPKQQIMEKGQDKANMERTENKQTKKIQITYVNTYMKCKWNK